MINLNSQLCEELGLTYWQLNTTESEPNEPLINCAEKELLKKILHAKGITLKQEYMQVATDGKVTVKLAKYQLVFNDANQPDGSPTINLPKLSAMLQDSQQKKLAWYKLKDLSM
ncbi:MAG: hypothetical protein L3J53_06060 [Proteobacteria bacterium]|nr:hypothetical protein [Pseudomonadota bacterium]